MFVRRHLMAAGLGVVLTAPAARALAAMPARRLSFDNLHTGEKLDVAYWERGAYVPQALDAVNHVLRDFRTGDVHAIAPPLLDLLTALTASLETRAALGVISGYRSPQTNAMLCEKSSQVASGSLHMLGEAIDIHIDGVETTRVRDAAEQLSIGGVGYYPTSDFVHVDIGRVRRWQGS